LTVPNEVSRREISSAVIDGVRPEIMSLFVIIESSIVVVEWTVAVAMRSVWCSLLASNRRTVTALLSRLQLEIPLSVLLQVTFFVVGDAQFTLYSGRDVVLDLVAS